ncbi:MAG: methylated-DNA--[protein]-cysteine S-methyltransferase [Clostridiales bacterium]|nr:methylated-DNA--[protein]-cysteine S-methyltransferase [Clostridiales bacterium]
MYYSTTCPSPVGMLTLASDGEHLTGLWIAGQKYFGGTLAPHMTVKDDLEAFAAARSWLDRYFRGERPSVKELSLRPAGGEFRQMVWRLLREIPYGEVTTYGKLAEKIAVKMKRERMSAQAVGGAVGHNPLSIIIPCHRVVGARGNLTGYAGGLSVKARLLKIEGADLSRFGLLKGESES